MKKDSEQHLRRFVACRDAGDDAGKAAAWEQLVVAEYDRMTVFVRSWRGGDKLSHHEKEEAISDAFVRVWLGLVENFEGSHPGEFVNAMRKCAHYACLDVIDRAAARGRREVHDDLEAEGRPTVWDQVAQEGLSSWEEDIATAEAIAHLRELFGQLAPDARLVLEHDLDGVPVEETCTLLGINPTTLYQRRRRAKGALVKLWSRDA